MATVTALESFTVRMKKDKLGPDRVEHHSAFPGQPSVFKGGQGFRVGSLERKIIEPGEAISVQKGQNFSDNHPVVKKLPHMFGMVETLHPVEPAVKK